MASPWSTKMNLHQQDFSMIADAGRSMASAYEKATEAIGKVGSAYFKEVAFENRTKEWLQSPMGKRYLKGTGVDTSDEKQLMKHVKGMVKGAGGFKEFTQQVGNELKLQQQEELFKQQQSLYFQQQEKHNAELDHANRMTSYVKNPKVTEAEEKIAGYRSRIDELTQQMEKGIISEEKFNQSFYDLGKKIGAEKKGMSGLKAKIPMLETSPESFMELYGEVSSPYQAMLKQGAAAKIQERADKKELESYKTAAERIRLQNLIEEDRSAKMMMQFEPAQRIVFDEGDKMQQVADFAEDNGLEIKPEAMEKMAQQITLVSPKEIQSAKRTYEKDNRLIEADTVFESAQYLLEFVNTKDKDGNYNTLTDTAAIEKLARMLQPDGILTEDDIDRMSGSKAVVDRFWRAVEKAKNGTLDKKSRDDLILATQSFQKVAAEIKVKGTESAIEEISRNYVSPDDDYFPAFRKQVRERFFSEEYNMIPSEFMPGNAKPVKEASTGDTVTVNVDGEDRTGVLDYTYPDGRRVVIVDGKNRIIDPE